MDDTEKPADTPETDKRRINLDTILVEEIGQFGLYQLRTIALLVIVVNFIAWTSTEYIFTAARIRTRCLIPECEDAIAGSVEFAPDWILNAVPSDGTSFDNCQRFANISASVDVEQYVCPAALFDQQTIIPCSEYVYEHTNTVAYTYELACDEWRRTLIGSLRTAGVLLALPMAGYISDRWGRRTALAVTVVNSAFLGVFRYFADSYVGFVSSQFIESAFGSGGFSCAYILMMETVGPKYRVAASATMSSYFAIGQVVTGLIAWGVPNWRLLTLTLYIPQFIAISFFWILPESVRWYLSKERYKDAEDSLKNIARINKKQLSEQSLQALKENAEEERKRQLLAEKQQSDEPLLVVLVFRHKPILLRCVVAPIWWITNTFIYYGLTINSVNISGNSYVNFIAVTAIEIPGYWIAFVLMNVVGRKPTLTSMFWICAGCQLAYLFMPNDMEGAILAVYMVGKCAIAVASTTLYVYTAELFPTKYRHRLFAYCSTMGRIGAIVAPLTPAFGEQLPFILFGGFALAAGLLVLTTPETRGAHFPDTMQEAARTGRSPQQGEPSK